VKFLKDLLDRREKDRYNTLMLGGLSEIFLIIPLYMENKVDRVPEAPE
jgi:hypothetical protein